MSSSSQWLSASASAALTTTPIALALGAQGDVPSSSDLPARCELKLLVINLTEIAGGMTEVTAWLSYDEDGQDGITPQRTTSAIQAFTPDPNDSTKGFVSWRLDAPFIGSSCHAHVIVNAGTATGRVKLYSGDAA